MTSALPTSPTITAPRPVHVPLSKDALGIWASLQAGRRNVLELIPEGATQVPILSGRTGKRWHMVMDPTALRRILRDQLDNYPKIGGDQGHFGTCDR